ncbi:hypothetical protein AB4Z39_26110 [Mycobacterium adipatum]|uniref:hypothetical protein n=1 Tax=Mycobacterium adipatum TaxID=1682113 RepID=UPI0034E0A9C8
MGKLITDTAAEIAALSEDDRPGSVIVAIMTDGLENAITEWSRPAIKSLIEQQTNQFGWEFLYMGADQDAVEVGRDLGVKAEQQSRTAGESPGRRWPRCPATCVDMQCEAGGCGSGHAGVQCGSAVGVCRRVTAAKARLVTASRLQRHTYWLQMTTSERVSST